MPFAVTQLKISQQEHRQRAHTLLRLLEQRNLSGVVLFDRDYILYYWMPLVPCINRRNYTATPHPPTPAPSRFALGEGEKRSRKSLAPPLRLWRGIAASLWVRGV